MKRIHLKFILLFTIAFFHSLFHFLTSPKEWMSFDQSNQRDLYIHWLVIVSTCRWVRGNGVVTTLKQGLKGEFVDKNRNLHDRKSAVPFWQISAFLLAHSKSTWRKGHENYIRSTQSLLRHPRAIANPHDILLSRGT